MAASMTLMVGLFVVLTDDSVISAAMRGLAMSYTIQVYLGSRWINIRFISVKSQCLQLKHVLLCCPVDRHASVRSEAVNRGGGKVQLGGAATGVHQGQTLDFSA